MILFKMWHLLPLCCIHIYLLLLLHVKKRCGLCVLAASKTWKIDSSCSSSGKKQSQVSHLFQPVIPFSWSFFIYYHLKAKCRTSYHCVTSLMPLFKYFWAHHTWIQTAQIKCSAEEKSFPETEESFRFGPIGNRRGSWTWQWSFPSSSFLVTSG